jgi:hypothetical protein
LPLDLGSYLRYFKGGLHHGEFNHLIDKSGQGLKILFDGFFHSITLLHQKKELMVLSYQRQTPVKM